MLEVGKLQRRERTLLIDEVASLKKARDFLNDKATSSKSTKNTYAIALAHLQTFLKNSEEYKGYDIETILEPLKDKTIDVYILFRNFRDYLVNRQDEYFGGKNLSPTSVILYVAAVRSYFESDDVDISDRRFKKKVTLPKKYRSEPEAIDDTDIRNMLNACSNKRLKAFIFLLATTGLRANETLLLKNSDVFFDESPVRIHIRAENTKTKHGRDIYTTDEAVKYLKIFLESKHDNKPDHILFKLQDNDEEHKGKLYGRLSAHFKRLLEEIGLDKRKDGDSRQRRQISFHSFRRFVKTTISDQGYEGFSEWLLGHRNEVSNLYYNQKSHMRKDLYKKLEKHLTFLDTTLFKTKTREIESKLEQNEKDYESKLKERDKEIYQLKDGMEELKRMYLKAMAGHVVMENDLDSKGRTRRKIIKS